MACQELGGEVWRTQAAEGYYTRWWKRGIFLPGGWGEPSPTIPSKEFPMSKQTLEEIGILPRVTGIVTETGTDLPLEPNPVMSP